jgi:hypothetical protein
MCEAICRRFAGLLPVVRGAEPPCIADWKVGRRWIDPSNPQVGVQTAAQDPAAKLAIEA